MTTSKTRIAGVTLALSAALAIGAAATASADDRYYPTYPTYPDYPSNDYDAYYGDYSSGYDRPYRHDRSYSGDRFLHRYDRNRDGYLDRRELRLLRTGNQLRRLFHYYDLNRDGYLSGYEINRAPLALNLPRADQNRDGYLSLVELRRYVDGRTHHYYQPQPRYVPQPRYRSGTTWQFNLGWSR